MAGRLCHGQRRSHGFGTFVRSGRRRQGIRLGEDEGGLGSGQMVNSHISEGLSGSNSRWGRMR